MRYLKQTRTLYPPFHVPVFMLGATARAAEVVEKLCLRFSVYCLTPPLPSPIVCEILSILPTIVFIADPNHGTQVRLADIIIFAETQNYVPQLWSEVTLVYMPSEKSIMVC